MAAGTKKSIKSRVLSQRTRTGNARKQKGKKRKGGLACKVASVEGNQP